MTIQSYQLKITLKDPVRVATLADVSNLASGAPNIVDAITVVAGDRILVWQQATGTENGIYRVTVAGTGANGTWVRDVDFDSASEDKVTAGLSCYVQEGASYSTRTFTLTTTGSISVGATAITFEDLAVTSPVAVADGGTGSTTVAGARTTLGLMGMIYDRVDDIGAGETMISNFSTSGFAGSSMGGWDVSWGKEGDVDPYYQFRVMAFQSSWNASSGTYRMTGIKVDASAVATLISGTASNITTADVSMFSDGTLTIGITGSLNAAGAHRLYITNNAAGYYDACILHIQELPANSNPS